MSDILKGLTSGRWTFLVAWALPSAITLSLFGFLVFPSIDHLPVLVDLADLDATQKAFVLAFSALALGIVLNEASTPLYRILEGYLLWPSKLQERAIERQHRRKSKLETKVEGASSDFKKALLAERLLRYPVDANEIVPTTLGNAIRSLETYGANRFNLDSQTFWSELSALVPESLQNELDQSRAGVDFFVNFVYQAIILASVSLLAMLSVESQRLQLAIVGLIALATAPAWYRLAIVGCTYWYDTVQALVNLGRKPLADAFGLKLPNTTEKERTMWEQVTRFVQNPWGDDESGDFDCFRQ